MPDPDEEMGRRAFLKLGVIGLSATALAFVAGCGGEDTENDDSDDGDNEGDDD